MAVPRIKLDLNDAKTAWFALDAYKDKLQHDLETGYDRDVKFGTEDELFLAEQIAKTVKAIEALEQQGVSF
jgi:hypothetical protein